MGDHHRPGEADDRTADHEDLQVAAGHVLAHRLGRDLVVADGAHHAAPGRFQRQLGQQDQQQQHRQEQPGIAQLDPDPRQLVHRHAPVMGAFDEGGVLLQVDLIRDGAGDAGDVLDAAGQPFLVLQDGDDDLADAQRGDGEIVGPQAKGHLAHAPGGGGGEQRPHRPGQQHRQAKPAEVAVLGGLVGLDRHDGGVEQPAIDEEARDHHRQQPRHPPALRRLVPDDRGEAHAAQTDQQRRHDAQPARIPRALDRRDRDQHRGQTAERQKAHDARVEQARIAPLHVHPKRHDGRDQPHVEDPERGVPRAREQRVARRAFQHEQHHQHREQDRAAPGAGSFGLTRRCHIRPP